MAGVEQGSSSNAMPPSGLATPSDFKSLKPNRFGSTRCEGTTVDSAEKMLKVDRRPLAQRHQDIEQGVTVLHMCTLL